MKQCTQTLCYSIYVVVVPACAVHMNFFCYVQASEVIFALFYLLTNGMCFYVQASELQVELPLNLSFYLGLS